MFKHKVVVVTGGVKGIGKEIVAQFMQAGAQVAVMDLLENPYFQGDVANPTDIEAFVHKINQDFEKVDILVNNALPPMLGIDEASFETFSQALNVGITGPFYLSKLLYPLMPQGSAIINISSSRQAMSQPQTESYSAAKGGIQALTHALAISLGDKGIRVNGVAPGWIETNPAAVLSSADHLQHPVGRVGQVADIANLVLYLASEKAGFITGQTITVDGGMSKLMIYHDDNGWEYTQSSE
ncbi:SDR family oxidoreductase [Fundicoccus culcitae]|uniref:SDR family oxidoreductase n=1 Tax=Fundicoccus culcitae TaxID=2969821 RepID=A0ABY5P5Z4_9LACT|nr:SDR family oxidoreductase [Fundicoccus culcitae]UUX33905.1 SDR family oxidoreductase [Fundicoccus culcitae]